MIDRFFSKSTRRGWLRWLPTIFAFPVGGEVAHLLAGPADHLTATLLGGAIFGAVLGATQAFALRTRVAPVPWIAASAAGMAAGVAMGAAAVDYGTGPADLALQGAITGAVLGAGQWFLLRGMLPAAWRWVPVTAAAWALGWTVTRAAGIDIEAHYYAFGLSGAALATILTGLLAVTIPAGAQTQRADRQRRAIPVVQSA